jgi:hypothetical protein
MLVVLGYDDEVMVKITRSPNSNRYSLLTSRGLANLTVDSGTVPVLCFVVKAKIFGLADTMKPKLELFFSN